MMSYGEYINIMITGLVWIPSNGCGCCSLWSSDHALQIVVEVSKVACVCLRKIHHCVYQVISHQTKQSWFLRTFITAYSLPVSCNHHCSDVMWAFRSFTRYSYFLLQYLWTNNNEIIKALHYWLFVRGIHRQEFGRLFHDTTACYVCVNQYYEFNYLFDVYVSYFLFCFVLVFSCHIEPYNRMVAIRFIFTST